LAVSGKGAICAFGVCWFPLFPPCDFFARLYLRPSKSLNAQLPQVAAEGRGGQMIGGMGREGRGERNALANPGSVAQSCPIRTHSPGLHCIGERVGETLFQPFFIGFF